MKIKSVKNLLGSVCFVLILILIFQGLTFLTRNKNEANLIAPYFSEKENSLDVVFVGSSHVMCGVYPYELYNDFGIASYDFTSSALVFPQAYYQVVEALKTQRPRLLVLDASGAIYDNQKVGSPEYVHVQLDNMSWSANKIRAINDLIEDPADRLEYYFPIIKFHVRWKELHRSDFQGINGITKGSYVSDYILPDPQPIQILPRDYTVPMSEDADTYLRKALDYCRDEGVDVLLLNTPTIADEKSQGRYNAVDAVAEEYGVPYINLLHNLDEIGFDYSTDLRDSWHCNVYGAKKVSAYIGNYLKEHYDLPDRRQDSEYAPVWNEGYAEYKAAYPY